MGISLFISSIYVKSPNFSNPSVLGGSRKSDDHSGFFIRSSGFWSVSYIYITNDNWSEYNVPWIQNRTGTWDDPHLIENVTVNAGGLGSPILIEDSKEFFIIRNCTVINSGNGVNDAGINFDNVQNGTITYCYIESNGNYGIRLFNSNEKVCNLTISNNIIRNNSDWGIRIRGYQNNTIINNQIINNVGGIRLYWSSNNNKIINNTITTSTGYDLYFYANSDYNLISNNLIISNDVEGIYFFNAGNEIFRNNRLYGAGFNFLGVTVGYASSMEIDNTTVNDRMVYYYITENDLVAENFTNAGQIILIDCDNCIISNVNLSSATIGLWLINDCDYNQVSNVELNNGYHGIILNGWCDNNEFINITADYNSNYGFYMLNGDNNVITESSFSYNQLDGLYIYFTCDYNNFSNNIIENNSHFGVNLRTDCLNNSFTSNMISNNDWGIYLEFNVDYTTIYKNMIVSNINTGVQINTDDCNETFTYYNNFLTNGLHALDDGTDSKWDDNVNGNYWDNYTGTDLDSDGIGDTPFNITGSANSIDNYPLMNPVDLDEPFITLNSPLAGSVFGSVPPTFNLTITDMTLNTTWYTINNSPIKYYFSAVNGINIVSVNQSVWNSLPEGNITINFFVNDSAGNISTLDVTVVKDLSGGTLPFGLPELISILLLIIISLVIALIIIGTKRRKRRYQ